MTFGKKTLFPLLLGFDLLANILELTHFNFLYISTLISFCTYILLPGFLISLILQIKKISFWENLLIIVGLSIAFLEFGGLLLNILLPLFGINDPLAFRNLIFGFDIYIFLLFMFASLRTKSLAFHLHIPRHSTIEKVLYTLPLFFPILAALGAIVLNNGGSNTLTLILLVSIALYGLLLVLFHNKISIHLYPYTLYFIGMASLFTTSLRSWYITGHDIETEFYVFNLTNTHHIWNMAFFQDAYNACLSITLLPTILTNLLSIQDMYVYKVIFQILFAASPVLVFFILRNYTTPIFAFLSAFLFLSFPTFFNDMAMLNRQEIGFIFFGLALYMMLKGNGTQQFFTRSEALSLSALPSELTKAEALALSEVLLDPPESELLSLSEVPLDPPELEPPSLSVVPLDSIKLEAFLLPNSSSELSLIMRRILFIIFALSVIVSHYSTNFVLLAMIVFTYALTFIISRSSVKKALAFLLSKSHVKLKNTFPNRVFLSLPLVLILLGATYFWNNVYTHSSSHASSVVMGIVSSMFVTSNATTRSGDLSYSLLFAPKQNPQQELQNYIHSILQAGGSQGTYDQSITKKYPTSLLPQEQLAPTSLGKLLSSFHIPVFNIQAGFRSFAADCFQIFVFIGLLALFFLKNKKPIDLQYLLLCFSAIFLLVLITVLPSLSVEYGVLRMFQQFLFILSLPITLGLSSVFFFIKEQKRILFIGIIIFVLFLDLTGFLPHLTGDYYPQMTLDNAGLYYDVYYVHKADVVAIIWLSENNHDQEIVVTDSLGENKLRTYGDINGVAENLPSLVPKNSYVFVDVSSSIIVSNDFGTIIYSSDKKFLDDNKDLIYSNGRINIYR
jgi:uncharacterized membrane protein